MKEEGRLFQAEFVWTAGPNAATTVVGREIAPKNPALDAGKEHLKRVVIPRNRGAFPNVLPLSHQPRRVT